MNAAECAVDDFTSVTFVPFRDPTIVEPTEYDPGCRDKSIVERIANEMESSLLALSRRIQNARAARGAAITLITGCEQAAGCTAMALALARATAQQSRVLIVDGNFISPGLMALLSPDAVVGWEENLDDLEHAVQYTDPERKLGTLTLGHSVPRAREQGHRQAIHGWLERRRQDYDLIIIDGGSVWDGGCEWGKVSDLAVLVCSSEKATADSWAQAWDRLEDHGTTVLGIVETFV